jgi:hypothetical protein
VKYEKVKYEEVKCEEVKYEKVKYEEVKYEEVNEKVAQGVANLMSDNLNEEMIHMSGLSNDMTRLYALA